MNGTSVLPDSESQKHLLPLLPRFLSLLMSSGAWPSSGALLPPFFFFLHLFLFYSGHCVQERAPEKEADSHGFGVLVSLPVHCGFYGVPFLSPAVFTYVNGNKVPTFLGQL